jgi:hypothetical protein
MSRDLTAGMAAAITAQVVRPIVLFEGTFVDGVLRLWSGLGELQWAGQTWVGAGNLLGFGTIEDTSEVVASGTSVSLSGIPQDLVEMAIAVARQGDAGRVYIGTMDVNNAVIVDPTLAFSGRLDVPEISDGENTCSISISYESRLIDLNRPREFRYTNESQQQLFPGKGDRAFEYITSLQSKEVKWGK